MGPAAAVLVRFPRFAPTWREVLSPFACDWLENDACFIADTTAFGGSYRGAARPFVGRILLPGSERSTESLEALELASHGSFTHAIEVAANCNAPQDHQILCETVAAIAERHDGMIDFGCLDAPAESIGFVRCAWTEEGRTYWNLLGTPETARAWLRHPAFHMLK